MKKNTVFLVISFLILSFFAKANSSLFKTLTIEEGQAQAAYQQKLLLVHFTANWCMPSKWMEENTFQQPEVRQYLDQDFLAIKVDVDLPQGFSDKENYQIVSLPTILIFSASGKLLDRIEGIATPENLLAYLKKYNQPQNRWARRPQMAPAQQIVSSQPDFSHLDKPAFATSEPSPKATSKVIAPSLPMPETEAILSDTDEKPVIKINREEYGVEVAVLQEYSSVIRYVRNLERKLDQKVYIILRYQGQAKNYHVIVGAYRSRQEAYRLRSLLMEHQIRGDVTALAFAK